MSRKTEEAGEVEAPASGVITFTTSEGNADDARKIETSFNFGGNTAQAVELFGEDAVYANFVRGARVTLQGFVRAQLSDVEKSDDDIKEAINEWKPGARSARGTSKTSKIQKLIDAMSPEEKEAFLVQIAELTA